MIAPPPRSSPVVPPGLRVTNALPVFTELLQRRTGQMITANRAWRIETALEPVLRERRLATMEQLAAEIAAGEDPRVADQVIDALLNQESSFFRDVAVIDTVGEAVRSMRAANPARTVRLWSAGCSSGQEPLSLAMLFAEQVDADGGRLPEIIATDVSEAAITRAKNGIFTQFEIQRGLSVRRMVRWFEANGADWIARPELIRRVAFRRMNLILDPLPAGRFDIILCRNVLMYLSPALRQEVLPRLAAILRPEGLLVLGAGETVIGQSDAFRPSRTYRGLYEPSGGMATAA